MKKAVCVILFFPLCFLTITVSNLMAGEIVDRIVAVVNDDIISLFELNQSMAPYMEKVKSMNYSPEKESAMMYKVREDLLNKMVEQKLTDQEIARTGIRVSEKDLDDAIEHIKKINYYTDEELRKGLQSEGMSYKEYRNRLKEQLLRTRFVQFELKSRIVITQEDVREFYDKNKSQYQVEKTFHLRTIIRKPPDFSSENELRVFEQEMKKIHDQLVQGADFKEMAQKHSQLLAEDQGDLGSFPLSDLAPQVQDAVKKLKVGEFTNVVRTDLGFQIFLLENINNEEGKAFEDVSAEIEEKIYRDKVEKKFNSWIKELRDRSHIRIIQ